MFTPCSPWLSPYDRNFSNVTDDYRRLSPVMQRLIGAISPALKNALDNAATFQGNPLPETMEAHSDSVSSHLHALCQLCASLHPLQRWPLKKVFPAYDVFIRSDAMTLYDNMTQQYEGASYNLALYYDFERLLTYIHPTDLALLGCCNFFLIQLSRHTTNHALIEACADLIICEELHSAYAALQRLLDKNPDEFCKHAETLLESNLLSIPTLIASITLGSNQVRLARLHACLQEFPMQSSYTSGPIVHIIKRSNFEALIKAFSQIKQSNNIVDDWILQASDPLALVDELKDLDRRHERKLQQALELLEANPNLASLMHLKALLVCHNGVERGIRYLRKLRPYALSEARLFELMRHSAPIEAHESLTKLSSISLDTPLFQSLILSYQNPQAWLTLLTHLARAYPSILEPFKKFNANKEVRAVLSQILLTFNVGGFNPCWIESFQEFSNEAQLQQVAAILMDTALFNPPNIITLYKALGKPDGEHRRGLLQEILNAGLLNEGNYSEIIFTKEVDPTFCRKYKEKIAPSSELRLT